MTPSKDISRLLEIMAALRDPEKGCPWDLKQTFETIKNYTIEEAYEVADAVERQDFDDLCDELGDLLLQPVFHAQMAAEAKLFDFGDVVYAITEKLIRRHPHIFDNGGAQNAEDVKLKWDEIKATERALKAQKQAKKGIVSPNLSVLDDVAASLPALMRAQKLDQRAASVGFDWPDTKSVLEKCREELSEIEDALQGADKKAIAEEIGDLLFAVTSLARHSGIDAETALRDANAKFTRRFAHVEQRCRDEAIAIEKAGIDTLDGFWNEIRALDKHEK